MAAIVDDPRVQQALQEEMDVPAPAETGPAEDTESWWRRLLTKTGPGSIESYQDNPLCWDRSVGVAQVLRGLTGMLGALDYALVDIVVGAWRWVRAPKGGAGGGPGAA